MANTKGYGTGVMKGRRWMRVAMLVPGLLLLISTSLLIAAEGSPRVLGTVTAMGHASMKGALDRWVPVDEKTYPLVAGAALRTELGTMSMLMKDGTSIDIGKQTNLIVNGTLNSYLMHLQLGTMAFKVHPGVGLTVTTPSTSVVVQRVSGGAETARYTFKDEVSGIITHDGKDTQVVCLRGKFSVVPANAETQLLTEGTRASVADPQAVSGSQSGTTTATPVSSGAGAPTSKVVVYESPTAPELTTQSRNVETGGLEVASEKTP